MADPKTKLNDTSVADFLNAIKVEQIRQDCWAIVEMMQKATNAEPKIWGSNIVGFGSSPYKYANGCEDDWPQLAFSPRKQNLTLYIEAEFAGRDELLARLGKPSCGKVCVYLKRLSDVHLSTLKKLIKVSAQHTRKTKTPAPGQQAAREKAE